MLHAIDSLDWKGVRQAFSDTVEVDYTALAGGEPVTMPADQLITTWRGLLPGFDATQHLTGPIVVHRGKGRTIAETNVRGFHFIKGMEEGDIWMVAGHYTFHMVREKDPWKISAIKLTVFYQEGNLNLPGRAQTRAKDSRRTR